MDFSTAHAAPTPVTIDGTRYIVPRFGLPRFAEWAEKRNQAILEKALAEIENPEHRAKFRRYWNEPLYDVADIADELKSPPGVIYVLETCLGAAGVPPATIAALIDNQDAVAMRDLASKLASVDKAVIQLQEQSGDGGPKDGDPLAVPPPTSEGVPSTGPSPAPGSEAPSDSAPKTE